MKSSRGAAIVRVIADGSGPLALEDRQAVERLGVDLLDLRDDESYWPADQATTAGAVLRRLEDEPRARLLLEALRAAKRPERAYRFVGSLAAPGRLDATKVMLERASTLTNDDHFDAGVSSPGEDAPEVFARALPEGGSAMLLRRLEKALGHHGFPRFLASRGETKKTWLEALRAIAAEALGARERIYLLEPEWRTAGSVAQGPSGSRCRGGPTAIVSATCSRSISRRRPSSARASRSPRRARARSRSTCRIHVAARTTSWACADQSPSRLRPF